MLIYYRTTCYLRLSSLAFFIKAAFIKIYRKFNLVYDQNEENKTIFPSKKKLIPC